MSTRVATANLPARKMTDRELVVGLNAVLDRHPRYLALQEVGPDRSAVVRAAAGVQGYRLVRAKGGPPVLYDHAATEVLKVKRVVLSRPSFVGHLTGRKSTLPASIATEVVFEDDVLGEVAVIDYHLTAEVQYGGRYRSDTAHRSRVRRHKREVRKLGRVARRQVRKGRTVFALGDGNFDGLVLRGLVSCWVGQLAAGTLGKRTVDAVFTADHSVRVQTVETGSDHRAVVVTYK